MFNKFKSTSWTVIALIIVLLICFPLLTILFFWFVPATDIWDHLADTVLTDYITNSLILMVGVSLIAGTIGTLSAWLMAFFDFPGKTWLKWALVLPLAFPTYIISYTYAGLLDYFGPVQSTIRDLFGFSSKRDYYFPDVMTLPGAIVIMSLVLYPYVYLIVRPVFRMQGSQLEEVGQTLGCSGMRRFWKISFPLARPAIVAGTSLALMEALNDFGTVSYYGINTFTTGIFRTWFNLGDLPAAARLAGCLMIFVLVLFGLEWWQRKNIRHSTTSIQRQWEPKQLRGLKAILAMLTCLLPVLFGFAIPMMQLIQWSIAKASQVMNKEFYQLITNSLSLALVVSLVIIAFALLLRNTLRFRNEEGLFRWMNRLATLGYAIPGSVIAVGVFIPLAKLDNSIDALMLRSFNISTGLILSGTLIAVSYGYLVRFLMIGYNSIDAGMNTIDIQIDDSAKVLGARGLRRFFRINLPLLKPSLLAGIMLVFIDILKELPATLILRPFNFDTLATRTYELASEEMLPQSAIYAITIVGLSIIPLIWLNHLSEKRLKDMGCACDH